MTHPFRLAMMACAASALAAAGNPSANAVFAQLPMRFEANQGQFAPSVRYFARASGYHLALTPQGPSFSFANSQRVNLSLPGSNASPRIEPLEPQAARTDYLIGARSNWHTGVPVYARVKYHAVYPGIDMVYYGKQNRLEFDFLLQPGADPSAIRMQFAGAGRLSVTAEGDLAVETGAGILIQKKPVVYQEDKRGGRRPVTGRYTLLAENVVGIRLGRYDRSQPLVIDPALIYTTLIGGAATDEITAMKLMPDGKLYLAGWTQTGDLATTDIVYDNLTDIYVQVIDTTAAGAYAVTYSTFLGGTNLDEALAIAVDAAGFIYLTGTTTSNDFPTTANAFQTVGATTTVDAFVSKLDPHAAGTGNSLVFSSYLGGEVGDESGNGIVVGANEVVYVIGTTKSPDFPVTANAYASALYGASDCFLAQVDTIGGTLLYATFIGSENDDDGRGIVLAPNGLVYFTATTHGVQFPMAGASYNVNAPGNYDVIVGAFDLTQSGVNSLVYSTYLGGSLNEEVRGTALDPKGRLVITGYTLSPDFPVTPATAVYPTASPNGDVFLAIVDPSQPGPGFLVYSTYLGGSQGEVGYAVAADNAGFIYVTGYTLSPDFPVTPDAIQPNWGGGVDMFLTRINPTAGGLAGMNFSTYIGLDSTIVPLCMAVGADGRIYTAGYTEGYLPLIGNSWQVNYGGGYSDGFLMVMYGGPAGTVPSDTVRFEEGRHDPPPPVRRRR
ncbi:MAG TPA: SBBP repeat-containing protein [Bryobacteraceae bacterium]|nr:SBBP repeat-containing protein [Bryobacteraceae bacterium]